MKALLSLGMITIQENDAFGSIYMLFNFSRCSELIHNFLKMFFSSGSLSCL